MAIAQENLKSQEYSADLVRRRQRGGFISGLDVANAEGQVAATKSQIPVLEQLAQQTMYNIALLLGAEPNALLDQLVPETPIPPAPGEIPVGLPSELLRRRPDIRRAEANLHGATARVGVATADLFPRFNITGSVNTTGSNGGALFNWNNGFWSIGPGVNWSLFNAGRIRANIAVQNELQEQAAIGYEQTVLTALRDVESALIAYSREQQHRAALQEAVAANTKAVDLSQRLYQQGQTDFLNVLSAQRSLYLSQDALVQSDATVATNLVSLYKALGGGWDAEMPAK
jgi:NodT family efflux transporter outer membrane factor (OMF) lipoprotein